MRLCENIIHNLSSVLMPCADSEGVQGVRIPPHSEKSQNIGFRRNTGPDPLVNQDATKPAFNVGLTSARQKKRHLNGVSLAGQRWPAFSGI